MIKILPDGLDTYVLLKDNAVLGWVSRSHWHGKWRALTASGALSFHYTRAAALEALGV